MQYALQALLRRRLLWPLIFTIVLLGAVSGSAQQIPPASRDSVTADTTLAPSKNPSLALLYSCLLPGAGQLSNGEKKKGYLMIGLYAASSVGYFAFHSKAEDPDVNMTNTEETIFDVSLLGQMGTWVWSCIDAPLSARRINRRNGYPPAKQNPWLALGLSWILPGTGQFYNGQNWKGALHMTLFAASMVLVAAEKTPQTEIGNAIYICNSGFAIADAYITAKGVNRKNGFTGMQNPGVGLVFIPDPRGSGHAKPGVGLRAGF